MKTGIELIASERERQVAKGFGASHDDEHDNMELGTAAGCYLERYLAGPDPDQPSRCPRWPWLDGWSPGDDMENLVKAGALIAAEIDRLNRENSNIKES